MNFWKIIKVISATIGEFQKAASDGVITLEATLRRLNVIR